MVLPLALAYGAVILLVFAWLFVDLWARSYDLPAARRVAVVVQAILFVAAANVIAAALGAAGAVPSLPSRLAAVAAATPPLMALLWCVHATDWRHVYVAAIAGCLMPLATAASVPVAATGPVAAALVLATMASRRELVSVRLRRYETMLASCSCCGEQQKAVHELWELGSRGESVIEGYVQRVQAEQASQAGGFLRNTTTIAAELQSCRDRRC